MTWWHEGLLLDGERLDARVEESLVSGEHIRSMSGTSTLTLTVHDPDRTLLTSGLLWAPRKRGRRARAPVSPDDRLGKTQLILSGDPYRLAGVRKDGHNLIATFEHEITALLREQTRPLVRSRESYTRAQFIRELVTRVKERRIAHLIFSADVRQPVERIQEPRRGVGRTEPVTIKGLRADAEQRRNIDLVLQVIEEEKAPEKAALALIEACIQEATFRNLAGGDRDSVGILQLRALHLGGSTSTRGGRRDVKLVARLFLTRGFWGRGGAIELARAHPNWTPGQIAQEVQGSGFPDAYEPHREEADAILQAGGGAGETITVAEEYIFRAGNLDGTREDYWDAIQRLAGEVDWRAFVTDNAFWYARDRDLLKRPPVAMIAEQPGERLRQVGVQYVGNIDFDWDYRQPVSELDFTAPAGEFFAHPGASVEVVDLGPADGRYLIDEIRDPLGDSDQEFTLRRAAPQKPEPAPTTRTIALGDTAATGPARQRIIEVAMATRTAVTGYSRYSQPGAFTDNPTPPPPARSDCSQWVHAVYVKAGLPSPGAWTGQQAARGRRVSTPRPGDLVFDAPSGQNHVEIFTGRFGIEGSDTIGHGTDPIDGWTVEGMRAHFGGVIFVTYDFLDDGSDEARAEPGGQTVAGGRKRGF